MEYANLHWHLRKLCKPEDINAPPNILPLLPTQALLLVHAATMSLVLIWKWKILLSPNQRKVDQKAQLLKKKHDEKIRFINATNYVAQTFNAMKSESNIIGQSINYHFYLNLRQPLDSYFRKFSN